MIDRETIDRITSTAQIEEVVGEFVSLKKRGSNHIGCCPFHNEKTPSFYVSPSKGIYKCFGCGEAGDVVKFLMKHEHYSYPEALRWLAAKYNIEIKEEELTEEQKERQNERDALFHLSEFAQKYFADLLYNDEMGRAVGLSYFHGRGLTDEIIKRFGLGYCLDEWTRFTDYARKSGYSDAVLEKTGLTVFKEKEGGGEHTAYDRFRGRVMFPVYSISGRVLGFCGRVLGSGKQAAKYVNSPDSDIYNKSRILYGLYQARGAIGKADKCYLVEGNVDVISMHQSGVENTVASCGTSLTVEQIRLIRRYTANVTVLYDGDSAGIKAALRAVDLLFAEGMHVRLVLFPDGEDPDSYAQKYGSTQLQEYLSGHEENFIMFKTRVLLGDVKDDPIKKAALVSDTANSIALVSDMIERMEYVRQCAQLLRVNEEVLLNAVGKSAAQARQKAYDKEKASEQSENGVRSAVAPQTVEPEPAVGQVQPSADVAPGVAASVPQLPAPAEVERHVAQLLLNWGNEPLTQQYEAEDGSEQSRTDTVAEIIVSEVRSNELSFAHPLCQRIFEQCALMLDMKHKIDASQFVNSTDAQLRNFAAALMVDTYNIWRESWKKKNIFTPEIEDNLLRDVSDSLNVFKSHRVAQIIADKREQLRGADAERQAQLLAEINQYTFIAKQLGQALGLVITPRYS